MIHSDVRFSLNVYVLAVRRRERMTPAEWSAYDEARLWASWAGSFGTEKALDAFSPSPSRSADEAERPNHGEWAVLGSNQ
jgi:hypothetical protein